LDNINIDINNDINPDVNIGINIDTNIYHVNYVNDVHIFIIILIYILQLLL